MPGAAYIFERESGVWIEKAKLTVSDGFRNDNFGFSVSIDGNYALVGNAPSWLTLEVAPENRGCAAYLFERDSSGHWSQKMKLVDSDGYAFDWFGQSVSLDGDYALVGASGAVVDEKSNDGGGAAYIFERDTSGNWSQKAKLVASDWRVGDGFGTSVSLNGNYALIGAIGKDGKGNNGDDAYIRTNIGAAYIFERVSGVWTEKAKLMPSDGYEGDRFGSSVSLDGDYALVGADSAEVDLKVFAGTAYIFERVVRGLDRQGEADALRWELKR